MSMFRVLRIYNFGGTDVCLASLARHIDHLFCHAVLFSAFVILVTGAVVFTFGLVQEIPRVSLIVNFEFKHD